MKKKMIGILVCMILVITSASISALEAPCTAPDNGAGTVNLPAGCPYVAPEDPMYIIDGLPPDTTIELDPTLDDFTNIVRFPGGTLGGEVQQFDATIYLDVSGTGTLTGFNRYLAVSVSLEVHTGPRNPGDPVQSFPSELFRLTGELFGDPDFCMFRMSAGSDHGLPSPGQITLTKTPSGDFAVDSFFDITYQIEFEGCPGSILEGYMGITTGTTRIQQGSGEPPYFEINIAGGLGITATVNNIGEGDATNVKANISVTGGLILVGGEKTVNIGNISANDTGKAKSIVIGFGMPTITVTVTCDEGAEATKNASAFVLLFLVLGVS